MDIDYLSIDLNTKSSAHNSDSQMNSFFLNNFYVLKQSADFFVFRTPKGKKRS